jgi:hypothetical protein
MPRMLVFVIVLLVLGLLGGCIAFALNMEPPAPTSPKGIVEAAIKAIPSRDTDKVTKYFTPAPGVQMALRLRDLYATFDDIRVENIWVAVEREEGINARVRTLYDLVVTAKGHENRQHIDKTVKLIRDEDRWYINEAF